MPMRGAHLFTLLLGLPAIAALPAWSAAPAAGGQEKKASAPDPGEMQRINRRYANFGRAARRAVPRDGFHVLFNPRMVTPAEAERAGFVNASTPVLGVVIGQEARAYPIPKLGFHELANDTVGKVPILVGW